MERKPPRWLALYAGLSAFSVLGTLLSQVTGLDPGPIKPVAAILTILFGFMAVFAPFAERVGSKPAWTACALVFAVGISAELCGLYTSFPFGSYRYSDQWAPVVPLPGGHFFPLLLPFAWMLVAGAAFFACAKAGPVAWLAGAVLAAMVDLFMEPVMVYRLGYWVWDPIGPLFGAPLMNFFGWVLTSAIAGLVLSRFGGREVGHPNAVWVLGIHMSSIALIGLLS